mmetsp:Transcript_55122/g.131358  ORF Transcript_55122/g.131358 Transcript_55122/m.131358 type:complete len:355 (+) Transcript_55122:98-1162(+)
MSHQVARRGIQLIPRSCNFNVLTQLPEQVPTGSLSHEIIYRHRHEAAPAFKQTERLWLEDGSLESNCFSATFPHHVTFFNGKGVRSLPGSMEVRVTTADKSVVATHRAAWTADATFQSGQDAIASRLRKWGESHGWWFKKPVFKVAMLGQQHAGKSSVVNTLFRWLNDNVNEPDVVVSAPASARATTVVTRHTNVPIRDVGTITLMDVPHAQCDLRMVVEPVLSGVPPGEVPAKHLNKGNSSYSPDGVILVASLVQWRCQQEETARFLSDVSNVMRQHRRPYVMALTNMDEYLLSSKSADAHGELADTVEAIKAAGNANAAFPLTNTKVGQTPCIDTNNNIQALLESSISLGMK